MTLRSLAWQDRAACAGVSVNLFFPDRINDATIRVAEKFCRACPVRAECADYGRNEQFGIWGGRLASYVENPLGHRVRRGSVPADGARRRIQALAWNGYGPAQIAELAGGEWDFLALARIRRGATLRIPHDLAGAIASVYRRLDGTTSTHPHARKFIEQARDNNWPDRDAWQGIDIDDPKASPR